EDIGVSGSIQIAEKFELLRDKGDPRLDRVRHGERSSFDAFKSDDAAVRLDHAAEHAHQRRLASAVLADQGNHLAARHGETDVVERDHAGIDLADIDQFEERLWHWRRAREQPLTLPRYLRSSGVI